MLEHEQCRGINKGRAECEGLEALRVGGMVAGLNSIREHHREGDI